MGNRYLTKKVWFVVWSEKQAWLKQGNGILPTKNVGRQMSNGNIAKEKCWKTDERFFKKMAISCGNIELCMLVGRGSGKRKSRNGEAARGGQTRKKQKWEKGGRERRRMGRWMCWNRVSCGNFPGRQPPNWAEKLVMGVPWIFRRVCLQCRRMGRLLLVMLVSASNVSVIGEVVLSNTDLWVCWIVDLSLFPKRAMVFCRKTGRDDYERTRTKTSPMHMFEYGGEHRRCPQDLAVIESTSWTESERL